MKYNRRNRWFLRTSPQSSEWAVIIMNNSQGVISRGPVRLITSTLYLCIEYYSTWISWDLGHDLIFPEINHVYFVSFPMVTDVWDCISHPTATANIPQKRIFWTTFSKLLIKCNIIHIFFIKTLSRLHIMYTYLLNIYLYIFILLCTLVRFS